MIRRDLAAAADHSREVNVASNVNGESNGDCEEDAAGSTKRPLPDSNRGWRICNPAHFSLFPPDSKHFPRALALRHAPPTGGKCRELAERLGDDPQFARLLDAWPKLPADARTAMLEIVALHLGPAAGDAKEGVAG